MNANDAHIWQALGMGPQWQLKTATTAVCSPNDGLLMAGNFELSYTPEGPRPNGQTGVLLLNMLAAISMSLEHITFLSLKQTLAEAPDLKERLKTNPFSQVVLVGDEAVQALFGPQSSARSHHGVPHGVALPGCSAEVVVLPALTDLIAQPALKAKAWESLCLIRARFLLPH
ncbi:MAG: hypothetical protein LW629_12145 [Burkholderiales bacterium]|nr:hypothetical protein [Burkholderiales bacterium]